MGRLIGTQFENLTGAQILHVPYKGRGSLTTDLLGGQITMSQMASQIRNETDKFVKLVKEAKVAID